MTDKELNKNRKWIFKDLAYVPISNLTIKKNLIIMMHKE